MDRTDGEKVRNFRWTQRCTSWWARRSTVTETASMREAVTVALADSFSHGFLELGRLAYSVDEKRVYLPHKTSLGAVLRSSHKGPIAESILANTCRRWSRG